jgi:type I restriction enzyme, S subunit
LIADLETYPEYNLVEKSTLGFVPANWRVVRIKSVMLESELRTKDGRGTLLSLSRARGLIDRTTMTDKAPSARTLIGYKLYFPGQIVMNRMQAWSGMFGAGLISGLVSPDYAVYSLRSCEVVTFLLSRLKCPDLVAEYRLESTGIGTGFNRLYNDRFGSIRISLPPPEEQELIVRFLDWASVRLGEAIAAKRKVIKLLEEQKQAIIHRAVARGLDDSVPLKPSGVDWLGDVPEHWEVGRLTRYLVKVEQGWSPVAANGELEEKQWAVLGLSAISRGRFNAAAIKPIPKRLDVPKRMEIKDGDILMTRSNTRDRVGDIAIVDGCPERTILSDLIYRLTLRTSELNSELFVYQMLSRFGRGQIETSARGSSNTMPKISQSHIKTWVVLAPPKKEQYSIVESLRERLSEIHLVHSEISREITLLQEYRTRLIADVVTGKLDVREFARTLPIDIAEASAEFADSELSEEDFSETDEELVEEPA